MTVEVTEVHLLDVASGEPVAAELWDAITEEQLADWKGVGARAVQGDAATEAGRRRASPLAAKPALGLAQEGGSAAGNAGQPGFQHRLRRTDPGHDDR